MARAQLVEGATAEERVEEGGAGSFFVVEGEYEGEGGGDEDYGVEID